MTLIQQSKIKEAALKYNPVMNLDNEFIRKGFEVGAEFAISELENISIEFAEWLVGEGWIQAESYNLFKNIYYADIEEDVRLNTKELFEIFLKEKGLINGE